MTATKTPDLAELDSLVGYQFPGDSFVIEPFHHWLTCDAVLSPQSADGSAHPIYVYLGALGGMGMTIDELFSLCHSSADEGGVLGESETEILGELRVQEPYEVRGTITAVARKSGQQTGVFDIVKTEFTITDSSNDVVAVSRNSFIFPRAEK